MINKLSFGATNPMVRPETNHQEPLQTLRNELPDQVEFSSMVSKNFPSQDAKTPHFGQQSVDPEDEPLTDATKKQLMHLLGLIGDNSPADSLDRAAGKLRFMLGLPPEEESPDAMDSQVQRLAAELNGDTPPDPEA